MARRGRRPPVSSDSLVLLGQCLRLDSAPGDLNTLRMRLLAPGALEAVTAHAGEIRLMPALAQRLVADMLVPPASASLLRRHLTRHRGRRKRMTQHLVEIVAALNGIGIRPVLLKGARSLWERGPSWRQLRDIDLLVGDGEAARAQERLLALGYAPHPELAERPHRHHLAPLYPAERDFWIELHRRAGNRYAERLLPTAELVAGAGLSSVKGAEAGTLDPVMHTLHAMVHHHVGHGGDARGTIDIKGLYEFAAATHELTNAEYARMYERADAHPRLAAMLDLWLAAAARVFALPLAEPFAVADDAAARAERMLTGGYRVAIRYPGYGDELRMAMAGDRLRRVAGGDTPLGRLGLRCKVVASLLPAIRR